MQEQQNKISISGIIVLVSHQLTLVRQLLSRPISSKAAGAKRLSMEPAPGLGSAAQSHKCLFPLCQLPTKAGKDQKGTSNDNTPPTSPSPNHPLLDKTLGTQTPAVFKPNPTLPVSPVPLGKRLLHHKKPGFSFCPWCSFTPDSTNDVPSLSQNPFVSGLTCPDSQ